MLADRRAARISINLQKSQLFPVRRLVHLGIEIDLDNNPFCAPTERWETLQGDLTDILREGNASSRQLYVVAGRIISLGLALGPVAQIFTRFLYAWGVAAASWDTQQPLTEEVCHVPTWHV